MPLLPGLDQESLAELSWYTIYMVIMTTMANLLLLTFVLVLAHKLNKLVAKLDHVSENAGKFVQMGMTYFKKK
jgi:hypothetical protein